MQSRFKRFGSHFNPLPRKEGDLNDVLWAEDSVTDFNPLPRKEGDAGLVRLCSGVRVDFNPLPRKEGDVDKHGVHHFYKRFQSTPS